MRVKLVLVEQFYYTPQGRDSYLDMDGYQVIAKSPGLTKEFLEESSLYRYPIGCHELDLLKINWFKALIKIKKKFVYQICINPGVGYDGRDGSLYTHGFVFDEDQFAQLDNNTRNFDKYFNHSPSTRTLPLIDIEKNVAKYLFAPLPLSLDEKKLEGILNALRKKRRCVILQRQLQDWVIQGIISRLEPEDRAITFQNMIWEPDRQYQTKLVLGYSNNKYRFEDYRVTDLG